MLKSGFFSWVEIFNIFSLFTGVTPPLPCILLLFFFFPTCFLSLSLTHTYTRTLQESLCIILVGGGFPGGSDGKESAYKMQDTQVHFLSEEDTLEKGMATHSCILPSPRIQRKPCHLHEKASRETDSQNCSGSPCRSFMDLCNYDIPPRVTGKSKNTEDSPGTSLTLHWLRVCLAVWGTPV